MAKLAKTTEQTAEQTAEATPDDKAATAKFQAELDRQAAEASATTAGAAATDESEPDKSGDTDDIGKGQSQGETTEPDERQFPNLTDKQVQAAKHLGYDDDEIAELTPAQAKNVQRDSANQHKLESKIGRAEQQQTERDERIDALLTQFDAVLKSKGEHTLQDVKSALGGTSATGNAVGDALSELEELSLEADYEEIVPAVNALLAAAKSERISRLSDKQTMDKIQSDRQEAAKKRVVYETDEFFESLDKKIYDDFGDGPTVELDKDSLEAEARRALAKKAKGIMKIHIDADEDASVAQCLDEALLLTSPEKYRKAAQKPLRDKLTARSRKGPAKPSSNATLPKDVDPEKEARRKMVEFAHSQGEQMTMD